MNESLATPEPQEHSLILHRPTAQDRIKVLRSRLLGMASLDDDWYRAVNTLEFAIDAHSGQFRNGGDPYIIHPVEASMLSLLLPAVIHPVDLVCTKLAHDTIEDCGKSHADVMAVAGLEAADAVLLLSKEGIGVPNLTTAQRFGEIAKNPTASLGKGLDRVHNQDTMEGFTPARKRRQVEETIEHVLEMLKTARRLHPKQERSYELLKFILRGQVNGVRQLLVAQGA